MNERARRRVQSSYNYRPNFMTPTAIRYDRIGEHFYELARGEWAGSDLFGVSVVTDGKPNFDLGRSFATQAEAEEYIITLGDEPNEGDGDAR